MALEGSPVELAAHRPCHHPHSCGDTRHQQPRRHKAPAAAGTRVRCLGTACCSHEAPVGPRVPAQLQSGFCQETPLPSIPTLALRAETCPVEGEQPLNACSFTVALEFCMMFRTMVFFFPML